MCNSSLNAQFLLFMNQKGKSSTNNFENRSLIAFSIFYIFNVLTTPESQAI